MYISPKFFIVSVMIHFGIVAVFIIVGQSHESSKIQPIFVELLIDSDEVSIETNSKGQSTIFEYFSEAFFLTSPYSSSKLSKRAEVIINITNKSLTTSEPEKDIVVNYSPSILGVNSSNVSYVGIGKKRIFKEVVEMQQKMIVPTLTAKLSSVAKKSYASTPGVELGYVINKTLTKDSLNSSFVNYESEQDIESFNQINRMIARKTQLLPAIDSSSKNSFAKMNEGNKNPTYPITARIRGIEGTVLLEIDVDHVGVASKVYVRKTSGYKILDRAAYDAVREWIFVPAQRHGKNVASSLHVPIRFNLSDSLQN